VTRLLNNSAKKDALVLDPFGGSGSTLIAAEQLNMRSAICELDPKYVDVIIRRWENLTGGTAELIYPAKAD
jgi:DNA modification methylase